MPRHGENISRTPTGRWEVQFKVKETLLDEDGASKTVWRGKRKTFDSRDDAENFRAEVRLAASRGERWEDKRTVAVVTLGDLADRYRDAASEAPESTQRFRKSMMNSWTSWVERGTPASHLSLSLLERYARSLPSEGRAAGTRHRKILEVERMWRWARKRPDLFPGVPEPMGITGDDAESVKAPPPVVRLAAPTWDDVDSMIICIRGGWRYTDRHRKVALLLRYTGMRISQAIGLRWTDLRLDHATPYVVVRAGRRGAKSGKGRVIPLHPALIHELRTWNPSDGLVVQLPEDGGAR